MSQLFFYTRSGELSLHYSLEYLGGCCENNRETSKIIVYLKKKKSKDFKAYIYILTFAILNQVVYVWCALLWH